ncbi:MAG: Hpt domain-containing protein [Acidobacteriaceae bacterium]
MDLEILRDYLVESKELLQGAQEDTLRLETDPGNDDLLASVFRAFHTIEGGAGFLEAAHLVAWAHDLEDLLDKLRSHALPVTSERIDAVLRAIDVISTMFAELNEMADGSSRDNGSTGRTSSRAIRLRQARAFGDCVQEIALS